MALDPKAKLAKFEGKLFVVSDNFGTLNLTPVSDEDVADAVVLGVDIDSKRDLNFEAILETTKKELLSDASKNLKQLVWNAMGFSTKWSDWEVRNESVVAKLIGDPIKEVITKNMLEPEMFLGKPEEQEKIKAAVRNRIVTTVKNCIDGSTVQRIIENEVRRQMELIAMDHVNKNMVDLLARKTQSKDFDKEKLLDVKRNNDGTITITTQSSNKNEYIDGDDDIPF